MEEWKEYKLGELIGKIVDNRGKSAPISEDKYQPIIEINSLGERRPNYNMVRKWVSEEIYNTWFRSGHPIVGDILMPTVGTIGIVSLMCENRGCIAQNIIALRVNEKAHNVFLYYYLKSDNVKQQLLNLNIGGVQPSIKVPHLLNLDVSLPSLETQQKIANILSSLDDKIEVNRRINEQLEELAQALFKSWFVDFDPFKDSEFVESELGMIPKGWKVGTLGDIANISSGKRPPMKQSEKTEEINIPLIGAASVMGFTNDVLYNKPILIIGRVGTHGIVQRFNTPCWPSDNTLVIESTNYEYVYQILKTIDYKSLNRGSTQPLITQTDVKNQIILIPNEDVLSDYNEIVSKIMAKSDNNLSEITHLTALRDTLLPKLMSGEIDVMK